MKARDDGRGLHVLRTQTGDPNDRRVSYLIVLLTTFETVLVCPAEL